MAFLNASRCLNELSAYFFICFYAPRLQALLETLAQVLAKTSTNTTKNLAAQAGLTAYIGDLALKIASF